MTKELSLIPDGVEMYSYPASIQAHVTTAAKAWQDFLALDQNTKDLFAATSLQFAIGYEKKGDGQRESKDIKENFDINRESLKKLADLTHSNNVAAHLIVTAENLFDDLEQLIAQNGQHLEKTYSLPGFAEETAASAGSAFVRFLYYPPTPAGTIIGEPHVDHSGFTFHLYESTDGCERLDPVTRTWSPIPVSNDEAVMFAGMQLQLFSGGDVAGLCHQIISNETTAQIGRIAIVCFLPLVNTPAYDRKTHGRLQEKSPGFNYDMTPEKFRELFTQ